MTKKSFRTPKTPPVSFCKKKSIFLDLYGCKNHFSDYNIFQQIKESFGGIKLKIYSYIFAGILSLVLLCGCSGEHRDFQSLIKKSEKFASEGNWEKSLEFSRLAVKCQPKNAEALVLNALALENNGKGNEALEEIAKAASIAPEHFFVQYTRGRMLFERGRYESCIAPLKNALKLRAGNPDTLVLLARVSTIQKNMQEAQYYYSLLAKSKEFSKTPAPWNELGMILLLDAKNPKKSISYFNYAYKLAPSDPTTVLNMAVLCDQHLGKKKEAKAFYQRYLQLTQRDSSLTGERAAVENRIKKLH